MILIIPTDDDKGLQAVVADHFGRCETYTLIDENGELIKVIPNTSSHMGGEGLPPELMKKNDADVLLCKGLGQKALDLCRQFGIDVYVCNAETVKELFDLWKNQMIKKAGDDDACKHEH